LVEFLVYFPFTNTFEATGFLGRSVFVFNGFVGIDREVLEASILFMNVSNNRVKTSAFPLRTCDNILLSHFSVHRPFAPFLPPFVVLIRAIIPRIDIFKYFDKLITKA
jgi:hypothetical protein